MDDLERAKLAQEERLMLFKQVKDIYKRGSKFDRFSRMVKGNAPDWSKMDNYRKEDFEYLLDVRRGDTYDQREAQKSYDKLVSQGKREPLSEKEINSKRFDQFAAKLGLAKDVLRSQRYIDEAQRKGLRADEVKAMEDYRYGGGKSR